MNFTVQVKPKEKIVDYRTRYSGITRKSLKDAPHYDKVKPLVEAIMKNRVIVGHSVINDFKGMKILTNYSPKNIPRRMVCARYR